MAHHPFPARRGVPDRRSRKLFVRRAARDLEQILPVFVLRIRAAQQVGASSMQRKVRVCRLLPPRECFGAHSSTLLPACAAVIAARSAALPPPNVRTSYVRETSIAASLSLEPGSSRARLIERQSTVAFDSLTTLAHFAVSDLMKAANCSGAKPPGSAPNSSSRCFMSGVFRIFTIAL
jgi:hypothetical protein